MFYLALVLEHSEPCINVAVSIRGKLQQGWRRWIFGHWNDPPKAKKFELRTHTGNLAPIIDALAAEIERLNTLPVPAHTVPAASAPAGDPSAPDEDPTEDSLLEQNV